MAAGRECVFPEVNRNKNIGEKGVNMNSQVFRQYLAQMSFNQDLVCFPRSQVSSHSAPLPACLSAVAASTSIVVLLLAHDLHFASVYKGQHSAPLHAEMLLSNHRRGSLSPACRRVRFAACSELLSANSASLELQFKLTTIHYVQ